MGAVNVLFEIAAAPPPVLLGLEFAFQFACFDLVIALEGDVLYLHLGALFHNELDGNIAGDLGGNPFHRHLGHEIALFRILLLDVLLGAEHGVVRGYLLRPERKLFLYVFLLELFHAGIFDVFAERVLFELEQERSRGVGLAQHVHVD